MDNYRLHLRITSVGSPSSGQPHAGGPGAGDVIVDQVIDLRQWVSERMVQDPVEPATPAPPVAEAVAPKERVWHVDTAAKPTTTSTVPPVLPYTAYSTSDVRVVPDTDETPAPAAGYGSFGDR